MRKCYDDFWVAEQMLFILYARIKYDLNTIVNLQNRIRSMLMRKLFKKISQNTYNIHLKGARFFFHH